MSKHCVHLSGSFDLRTSYQELLIAMELSHIHIAYISNFWIRPCSETDESLL